jgi:ABC-type dipeptide/oligopeptide/nickel transport system permease subunit
MKRTLHGIALAVAIAAILAPAAQAKPTAVKQQQPPVEVSVVELGPGEIPYVNHAKLRMGTGEVPYLDDGASPSTVTHEPAATIDDGADVAYGIVSGAAIALLLAFGLAFVAVRQTRKTRLSPA